MWSFIYPSDQLLAAHVQAQASLPFSYSHVGKSVDADAPPGFDNDFNEIVLGNGEAVWEKAKQGIRQWEMFPGPWTRIAPALAPIREGSTIVMMARVFGVWWWNACRIVYCVDEPNRFGFAYGTLPGHVELGEELFVVEKDTAGIVRYRIRAFSRPRHWLVRLTYPLARRFQKQFVRDSKAAMLHFINQ